MNNVITKAGMEATLTGGWSNALVVLMTTSDRPYSLPGPKKWEVEAAKFIIVGGTIYAESKETSFYSIPSKSKRIVQYAVCSEELVALAFFGPTAVDPQDGVVHVRWDTFDGKPGVFDPGDYGRWAWVKLMEVK